MNRANKFKSSMVIGCCMIFSFIVPPVGCVLLVIGGALAVSWHIDDSDQHVTPLDAMQVSLLTCALPFILFLFLYYYLYLEIKLPILLSSIFLFTNLSLGLIVRGLSVRNRELRDRLIDPDREKAQQLSAYPTELNFENLSPSARAALLAEQARNNRPTVDKQTVKIKTASLPTRCEICHQSDQFNPANNHCARCAGLR